MIDYSLFYKKSYRVKANSKFPMEDSWDIFISSYNHNDKIKEVFDNISAKEKYWLIQPEYGFLAGELPPLAGCKERIISEASDESRIISELFDRIKIDWGNVNLCVDISGFLATTILYLLFYLRDKKIKKIDIIYSEPVRYKDKEQTDFYSRDIVKVRQVNGFEGIHRHEIENDVLVIGTGYDDRLILSIAENKEKARKIKIYGFPSLRPDMYQENILRVHKVSESIEGIYDADYEFAPANDPFETSNVLKKIFENLKKQNSYPNVYLAPLGTKAQALGFGLFYLNECKDQCLPVSIIFPVSAGYEKKTSEGLSRIWRYTVEFIY
jgi:hypothetical protein